MQCSASHLRAIGVALVLLAIPGAAQTLHDSVVIGAPDPGLGTLPLVFDDGLAHLEPGGIRCLHGMPLPVESFVPLTNGTTPAGTWQKLDSDTGAYRTASGEVVLVRGLPDAPLVVPTGLVPPPGPFVPIDESTAVLVEPATDTFWVLEHGAGLPALHAVPSGFPLGELAPTPGEVWPFGRADGDRFMGLGPGADRTYRTGDERLIVLAGLSGPSAGYQVQGWPLPAGEVPVSFALSDEGTGLWAQNWNAGQVPLTAVTLVGAAPAYVPNTVAHPALLGPGGAISVRLEAGPGSNFLLHSNDDACVFMVTLLKNGAASAQAPYLPVASGFVSDGCNLSGLVPLAPDLVGAASSQTVELIDLSGPAPVSALFSLPGDTCVHLAAAGRDTVLAFWQIGPGPSARGVTVIQDPHGLPGVTHQFAANDFDFGVAPISEHLPARVSWFSHAPGIAPTSQHLTTLTLPEQTVLAGPPPLFPGTATNWLSVLPARPRHGDLLRLQVIPDAPTGLAWLFVATTRLPVPMDPLSIGFSPLSAALFLDPLTANEVPLLPGPIFELQLPTATFPPALLGLPFYFQAMRPDSSWPGALPQLSHAIRVSVG